MQDTSRAGGLGPRLQSWTAWAVMLAALYVLVYVVGWNRNLLWDEIWILHKVTQPFHDQLEFIRRDGVHPPLMYLAVRGWVWMYGDVDGAARSFGLLFGVPTLVLFTWLATRVTRHWRAASLLLLGVYLQTGSVPNLSRGYGLVVLGTVLAVLSWQKWNETRDTKWLACWTLVMTLLVYVHYFGLGLLAAFGVLSLLRGERPWLSSGAAVIPVVAIVPWLLYVFPAYRATTAGVPESLGWIANTGAIREIIDLMVSFMTRIQPGGAPPGSVEWFRMPAVRRPMTVVAVVVHLALLGLAFRTVVRAWPPRRGEQSAGQWFWNLTVLAGIPIGGLVFISVAFAPLFHPRFLVGLLPIYWLLITLVCDTNGRMGRALLYGAVVPVVLGSSVLVVVQEHGKSALLNGVRQVDRSFESGDLLLADHGIGEYLYWEWAKAFHRTEPLEVFRGGPSGTVTQRELMGNNTFPYHDADSVETEGARRIWLFYSDTTELGRIENALDARGFRPAAESETTTRDSVGRYGPRLFVRRAAADPGSSADAGGATAIRPRAGAPASGR